MNEIKQVKSELRFKEWAGLIAECQSSTQTVKAWCLEHDINPKSYYYWLEKVRLARILGDTEKGCCRCSFEYILSAQAVG